MWAVVSLANIGYSMRSCRKAWTTKDYQIQVFENASGAHRAPSHVRMALKT